MEPTRSGAASTPGRTMGARAGDRATMPAAQVQWQPMSQQASSSSSSPSTGGASLWGQQSWVCTEDA